MRAIGKAWRLEAEAGHVAWEGVAGVGGECQAGTVGRRPWRRSGVHELVTGIHAGVAWRGVAWCGGQLCVRLELTCGDGDGHEGEWGAERLPGARECYQARGGGGKRDGNAVNGGVGRAVKETQSAGRY